MAEIKKQRDGACHFNRLFQIFHHNTKHHIISELSLGFVPMTVAINLIVLMHYICKCISKYLFICEFLYARDDVFSLLCSEQCIFSLLSWWASESVHIMQIYLCAGEVPY